MKSNENSLIAPHPEVNGERKRKRLLFTLGNLEGGGAERVVINLLRHLDRSKFELHLAVVHYFGNFIDSVPEDIVVHDLKAVRVRRSFPALIRLLHRLKPDVLFSSLGYLNLAIIFLKPFIPRKTKIIIRETSIVTNNLKDIPYSRLWKWFYRTFYNRPDAIICSCDSMIEDLAVHFRVKSNKMIRIFNPVDIEAIKLLSNEGRSPFQSHGPGPHIVAIGRLSHEKGFDRLIQEIPFLLEKKPNARLWILGHGKLEKDLKELIKKLNLENVVLLTGFQQNPFLWLNHADLFVLSSRFEGLPNTLLEALACGCPVVALNHPGGTREVLGILGLEDRFVDSLDSWLDGWWERPNDKVANSLGQHFGMIKIIKEYENLISQEDVKKT
jgi:glycosyltransferase involved in cell wall biosynthesis